MSFTGDLPSFSDRVASHLNAHTQPLSSSEYRDFITGLEAVNPAIGRFLTQTAFANFSAADLNSALARPREAAHIDYLSKEAHALTITGNAVRFLVPDLYPTAQVAMSAGVAINNVVVAAKQGKRIEPNAWQTAVETADALEDFSLPTETYSREEFGARINNHLSTRSRFRRDRLVLASLPTALSAAAPENAELQTLAASAANYAQYIPADDLMDAFSR